MKSKLVKKVKLSVVKGDTVLILSGKDKGKQGKIIKSIPDKKMVVVEGANIVTRHTKPSAKGRGGIQKIPAPLSVSKVMLICPKCKKPTRVKHKIDSEGTKHRYCSHCNEVFS
ncbi:50S ribosomal protein L24 [Thermodesulfobium sp.]|jgi:large subunit ribosomal protein L24|uniref:Large ribosomal subunit protein uL24 n=1 Tax=Thermodesulfobium narugense TaxID=184064 RepID=A0A7C5KCP9_9BACT